MFLLLIYLSALSTALYYGPSKKKWEMQTQLIRLLTLLLFCIDIIWTEVLHFFFSLSEQLFSEIKRNIVISSKKWSISGNLDISVSKGYEERKKKKDFLVFNIAL